MFYVYEGIQTYMNQHVPAELPQSLFRFFKALLSTLQRYLCNNCFNFLIRGCILPAQSRKCSFPPSHNAYRVQIWRISLYLSCALWIMSWLVLWQSPVCQTVFLCANIFKGNVGLLGTFPTYFIFIHYILAPGLHECLQPENEK